MAGTVFHVFWTVEAGAAHGVVLLQAELIIAGARVSDDTFTLALVGSVCMG